MDGTPSRHPALTAALRAAILAALLSILTASVALGADLIAAGTCGTDEITFDGQSGVNPADPDEALSSYDGCSGTDEATGQPITVWAWTSASTSGREMIEVMEAGEFGVLGANVERTTIAGGDVVVVDLFSGGLLYYWTSGNTLFAAQTSSADAAERVITLVGAGRLGDAGISSVPGPAQISLDPVVVATSAAIAGGVALTIPFPGTLFNSTLDANYAEVVGWFRRFRRGTTSAVAGIRGRLAALFSGPRGVALFIGVSSVLYGFIDPRFGLNLESVLIVIGLAAGLAVVGVIGELPKRLYAARRLGEPGILQYRAGGLLVALGCVIVTRITDFQPGYVYGLVVGYTFSRALGERDQGKAAAIDAAASLALALAAFVGLGVVRAPFGQTVPTWLLPADIALATVVISGIENVLFGLMPVRYLPGEALMRWSRLGWAALFGTAAFAFFHVLVNPSSGYLADTTIQPLLKVVALGVGFGVVSVLFWAYFRYRKAPPTEPSAQAPAG